MRIQNKLTTVQLVMTLTLILSIFIFSLHMYTIVEIDNAKIELSKLDTKINIYKNNINTILNRRIPTGKINNDLSEMLSNQKEHIDFFINSQLLSSNKEKIIELNIAYMSVNNQASIQFLNSIKKAESKLIDNYIMKHGIMQGFKLVQTSGESPEAEISSDKIIKDQLTTMIDKYTILSESYSNYLKLWNETYSDLNYRLEKMESNSLARTITFLVLIIAIALILNYYITHNITLNLSKINKSLASMSQGDFSSELEIYGSDEFGELSRNFNEYIDQLWKKLDSMNILMHNIGQGMNEDLNISKVESSILTNISNHIKIDSSAIFNLVDGKLVMSTSKGHFPPFYPIEENLVDDRPKASRYLYEHDIPLDIPIIDQCLSEKETILVKNCADDIRFPQCSDRKSALYIKSIMLVPLLNSGEVIGLYVAMRNSTNKPFTDLDYSNFISFSDYASLTIDTIRKYNDLLEKFEMQKEIGVAADIQSSLVPSKMPEVKGLTSSAFTVAAKGVSGDYYDFFRMNQYTIGATVCDVAGKGVPASLVMVMIRTILRLISSPSRGAAETLTMLNRSISGKIDIDRYATMGFFKIDLKNMKLNYSNAAHHPIQIYRQSTGKFYAVDSPGLPIGIDRDSQFHEKRVSLEPGDIIFMYTDGFPEARNSKGDEYSTQRMLREIRLHCKSSANKILDSVIEDMHKFTARATQHDDQTILIIKIDEV